MKRDKKNKPYNKSKQAQRECMEKDGDKRKHIRTRCIECGLGPIFDLDMCTFCFSDWYNNNT